MFESVGKGSGDDALDRAVRIFEVLTVLAAFGAVLRLIGLIGAPALENGVMFTLALVLGLLAWFTARGIEAHRPWARALAYIQGLFWLLNFPIGTVIGIAVLVYVRRASKAGLFVRAASAPPVSVA